MPWACACYKLLLVSRQVQNAGIAHVSMYVGTRTTRIYVRSCIGKYIFYTLSQQCILTHGASHKWGNFVADQGHFLCAHETLSCLPTHFTLTLYVKIDPDSLPSFR